MTKDLTPDSIGHIARGFSRARVLLTGVELDIFTLLAGGPLSADQVAGRLGSDLRATTILLDALTAMELFEKVDGRYRTASEAAPLLTEGSPESMLPGMRHTAHLWKTWSQLTDIVLSGGPARRSEDSQDDWTKAFIGAMHVRARKDAEQLVADIGPGDAGRLSTWEVRPDPTRQLSSRRFPACERPSSTFPRSSPSPGKGWRRRDSRAV